MSARSVTRRGATGFLAMAGLSLPGCGNVLDGPRPRAEAEPPSVPATPAAPSLGPTIGTGPVKVALILPLGASQGGPAALSLRNAAEMAFSEFQGTDLTILVKDDRGTGDGARLAAEAAIADEAELILGPLFAPSVAAAATVARAAGRPLIAFSTDSGVAARGTYLLSFLPQTEVDRVVAFAAGQGRRSAAALIPDTTYGSVVEAAFQEAAARRGIRVAALERYAPGQPGPAAARLASVIGGAAPQADALFMPAPGEDLAAIAAALQSAGLNAARVRPLGTGFWNDPRAAKVAALQGGWFASPDPAGFAGFAERYRTRFGAEPARIATLAYDAVSLASALARTGATARYTEAALLSPSGFAGADGVFRFRSDGTNERALAVSELRPEGAAIVSPAPKAFAAQTL